MAALLSSLASSLPATEFTISTYNCGGLTNHYDYLRAASMQKIIQERHNAEPDVMALNKRVQQVALKILFSNDTKEVTRAQTYWNKNELDKALKELSADPTNSASVHHKWNKKINRTISGHRIRPITITDSEITQMINDHVADITKGKKGSFEQLLTETRAIMAQRIFQHHLKYDIICLQEADYLNASMFPHNYEVVFSNTDHSVNGIAWNKDRFEQIETIGNIMGRAFAMQLMDKYTGKTVLVASAHLTGCNPFSVTVTNSKTHATDADKGNNELSTVIDLFEQYDADMKIIAMDSNVTSTHPRLKLLKNGNYILDAHSFLEATCSNPNQVLNTRIDWIALRSNTPATVSNIPVLGVGLNSIQTNMSDHKPIAAKIQY